MSNQEDRKLVQINAKIPIELKAGLMQEIAKQNWSDDTEHSVLVGAAPRLTISVAVEQALFEYLAKRNPPADVDSD